MSELQWKMKSKLGDLFLTATEKGLTGVFWDKQEIPMAKRLDGKNMAQRILASSVMQIEEYLTGKREKFKLDLDLAGTPFQKSVWAELLKIPYGSTTTYKELAKRVKRAKAVRAVGAANALNPLSIIIPCHRVISSSGSLQGYSGGIEIKAKLLKLEGAISDS